MQPSKEEKLRELREERRRLEQEDELRQLSELGREGLAWLALAPAWTEQLAEAASFPAGTPGLAGFLERADASGVCERGDIEYPREFWIRRGEQRPTLEMLKSRFGLEFLRVQTFQAGFSILSVQEESAKREVSPRIGRWAQLAVQMQSSLSKAADWLEERISELLDRQSPGEVMGWLDTAAPLAAVFGGKLADSVRLGQHRLELVYRRRQDERHVQSFLPRKDQVAAFDHLVDNRDGVWALHYLGIGGVGKTMLLRYITARLARARRLPIARIDFDYISADYPARRPGQLLIELVTELLGYHTDAQLLRRFRNHVDRLHEALSRDSGGTDPVTVLQELREFYDPVIAVFCELIAGLAERVSGGSPQGPVILVLDTCEELAKFQPPGVRLPSVEATFKILEDVHQTFEARRGSKPPPFRVIFAGRRPLAQGGRDWSLTPHSAGRRHLLPSPKSYLALHELRGFDHDEARTYLCEKKGITIPSRSLYRTVLRHSRETGRVVDLEGSDRPGTRDRVRYNPFDLALYADWLKSNPGLSAEQIASGGQDPYIEYRILERLRQRRVVDLLPSLVLLGRFDQALLARLARGHGLDDAVVARELLDNEWIDGRHDAALDAMIFQINGNLLSRLRTYYGIGELAEVGVERSHAVESAKRELRPILRELFADPDRRLSSIPADSIDAAMRVLPTGEGAELWDRIEQRIPAEADWPWATRVLALLVSEDAAVNGPAHPLWPALQATLASAQLHADPGFDVRPLWLDVLRTLDHHPVGPIQERLRTRALLGTYAARTQLDGPIDSESASEILAAAESALLVPPGTGERYPGPSGEQTVASACAALDRVLDLAEAHGVGFPAAERLDAWARSVDERGYPSELSAFATMLAGRALWLDGERERGRQRLGRAATLEPMVGSNRGRWFGWVPPRDPAARLQLEAIRAFPAVLNAARLADLRAWRSRAVERHAVDSIDGERLVAASLDRELAMQPVPPDELDRIRTVLAYDLSRKPSCLAHERTPHLILVLARAYVAVGRASNAIELLTEHKKAAISSAQDDATVRAAQTGVIETIRRTRVPTDISLLDEWFQSGEVDKVKVAWPAAVLVGFAAGTTLPATDTVPDSPEIFRLWASCRGSTPLPERFIAAALELAGRPWHELEADAAGLVLLLNEVEGGTADAEAWWREHPDHADEAFRFALHVEAQTQGRLRVPRALISELPPRRRAQIALEEGELLALRRPAFATTILDRAIGDFRAAGDAVGRFQSTICALIARIGSEASARSAREFISVQVAPAYADAAAVIGRGWPEWSEFRRRGSQALDLQHDPEMGQWMRRLLWCLDHARVSRRILRDLRSRRNSPPFEIAVITGQTSTKPKTYARSLLILVPFLSAAMVLAVLGGLLWASYQGYDWVLHRVGVSASVSTGLRVSSFVAGAVALVVLATRLQPIGKTVTRWLQSWFASRILVSLSLNEIAEQSATLKIEMLSTRFRWSPPFIHPAHERMEAQAVVDDSRAYHEAAAHVDAHPVTLLRELRERLGGRTVDVVLEATRRWLHEPAWEGILAHALKAEGEPPAKPLETLRVWRQVYTNAPRSPWTDVAWRFGPVRVISSDSAAHAVEAGWLADPGWHPSRSTLINTPQAPRNGEVEPVNAGSGDRAPAGEGTPSQIVTHILESQVPPKELRGLALEVGVEPASLSADERRFARDLVDRAARSDAMARLLVAVQRVTPERAVPYRILHIIGTPVETASELTWQVASTREAEASYAQSFRNENVGFAGQLLNADELPVQFAPLIVLQLEPTSELRSRTPFDREQAGLARGFAYKLVTAGAPAVLTLPTLTYDGVPLVLRAIASALSGKTPPDRKRLLNVVRAARMSVAQSLQSLSDVDAEEPAFDVCLMIRSPTVLTKRNAASRGIPS